MSTTWIISRVAPLLLALALSPACSKIPTPGVYKLDVQQGNVVTAEMLARLEPGMEKRKVRFLLGTPLIADTFNPDRWDYVYSFQEGGKRRSQRRVVVIFEDERLARIEGDVTPATATPVAEQTTETTVVSVPDYRGNTLLGGLGNLLSKDETRVPKKTEEKTEETQETESALLSKLSPEDSADEPASDREPVADGEAPAAAGVGDEGQVGDGLDSAQTGGQEPALELSDETDEEGFFARLKKKLGRADETGELDAQPGTDDTPADGPENEAGDEKGFFQRLSDKFGLDSRAEGPEKLKTRD